jgi:tetratricopeptide (TPR) repeat protein
MFQRGSETAGPADAESKAEPKADMSGPSERARENVRLAPLQKAESTRAAELLAGIKAYDDGKYAESGKVLRSALPSLNKSDQVQAHKYLGFIECSLGRKTQCRMEFTRALKIDPGFELEPSEAGHPLWGPVFRSVKQKSQQPQQNAGVKKTQK